VAHRLSATIYNQSNELPHLRHIVEAFLPPQQIKKKIRYAIDLILEEVITNVIDHGYEDRQQHEITVRLQVDKGQVAIRVEDDGKPFNPLAAPRLNTKNPSLERLEGGLGIHLVRSLMNSMAYHRDQGKNIFEIWLRY